ncbi:helix-turn-helix domain-containing protein [Pontibacter pamirensis]|uniref:helix-turn-helix domain-containing protein n=1 Tax=Pontibacter pamirensis TaxID=2562824 RepID=UPI001F3CC37F|nr:helix-turn-helix domain-containing protein [Pontibacter pamirensis]
MKTIVYIMAKPRPLYPYWQRLLAELGGNIKLARLRRKLSTEQVAERAAISRPTLSQIEKGEPTVAMGNYLKVLAVLGLEKDLAQVGRDDKLGRKLQDAELSVRERAPKHSSDT